MSDVKEYENTLVVLKNDHYSASTTFKIRNVLSFSPFHWCLNVQLQPLLLHTHVTVISFPSNVLLLLLFTPLLSSLSHLPFLRCIMVLISSTSVLTTSPVTVISHSHQIFYPYSYCSIPLLSFLSYSSLPPLPKVSKYTTLIPTTSPPS